MTKPTYAILRINRLKSKADLDGATRHGKRQDTGTHFDPERTQYNEHYGACRNAGPVDWAIVVEAALERRGAVVRKGASVAAEFFVGASPEFFAPRAWEPHFNMERVRAFADAVLDAFYERFGDMVVAARLDLDEGSPHMAICVVPIYDKVTKAGSQPTVSYRKVFGGNTRLEARINLMELQDWFAEKMAPVGLSRGVPKSVTHREHMSHHQYAKRRREEDELRAKALSEAALLTAELAQKNRELQRRNESLFAMQKKARADIEETTRILLEAGKLHAWISRVRLESISRAQTDDEMQILERSAQVMSKFDAHFQALEQRTDELTASDEDAPDDFAMGVSHKL